MMTTSGFLSPAREGRLPESRTPLATIESVAPANTPVPPVETNKRPTKVVKKVEKKKDKMGKELFKTDEKPKKPANMKDVAKLKQMRALTNPANSIGMNNFMFGNDLRISPIPNTNKPSQMAGTKINKALVAARQKTEKLNTTITPIPMKPTSVQQTNFEHVDKLFTEPDKKKVNILKKISNVKNEKLESKVAKVKEEIKQESRESSPDLIIDETAEMYPKVPQIFKDITIELVRCPQNTSTNHNERTERAYFDNDSPPGTPSTPKTPEMISHSPPLPREKRKRKDKSKIKKVQKTSPLVIDDAMDMELERPKTPEAQLTVKQEPPPIVTATPSMPFPFLNNFGGPGLIPPLNSPLYPSLAFPPLMHGFGQTPYMPPTHPGMPINLIQPPKVEELPQKIPEKPVTPTGMGELLSPPRIEKKLKEHKKEKKDKLKKKNKKDKLKSKAEKKKLKEEKKDKDKIKKEKKERRKDKEASIFDSCVYTRIYLCIYLFQVRDGETSVPKLTLKLGSSSPCPPENLDARKL